MREPNHCFWYGVIQTSMCCAIGVPFLTTCIEWKQSVQSWYHIDPWRPICCDQCKWCAIVTVVIRLASDECTIGKELSLDYAEIQVRTKLHLVDAYYVAQDVDTEALTTTTVIQAKYKIYVFFKVKLNIIFLLCILVCSNHWCRSSSSKHGCWKVTLCRILWLGKKCWLHQGQMHSITS